MTHRRKNLTTQTEALLRQKILDREKFQKLAHRREVRATKGDNAFIKDYIALCIKHRRIFGDLTSTETFNHLRSSKVVKRVLGSIGINFRSYNRHEDHFPDVGSGWHLGNWRE